MGISEERRSLRSRAAAPEGSRDLGIRPSREPFDRLREHGVKRTPQARALSQPLNSGMDCVDGKGTAKIAHEGGSTIHNSPYSPFSSRKPS